MKRNRVDVISLGCSKNLVDSERLMSMFREKGYDVEHDAEKPNGEIVVVNTCGFIGDAKEESVNMILELTELKKQHRIGKLYVMGCLSERYRKELAEEIPEVDAFYGKFDWTSMVEGIGDSWKRKLTTPRHYAYVKIAEGCDRRCSYCAIPSITGQYKSRQMDEILDEVHWLASEGVREVLLIAQDLTYYGMDLEHRGLLPELVERISEIEGIEWIRLHYAYPIHFPYDLLKVMRDNRKVCKYLDVALQHISDNVLDRMHRNITKAETMAFVKRLRSEVPGLGLRTTLMVGFPGETDDDFNELVEFVREVKFERMGAFAYCEEEGTYSALHYSDDVAEVEKERRLSQLMKVQQEITAEVQHAMVGRTVRVLIDHEEGEWMVGRTEWDSVEVDCEVFVKREADMKVGEFYNVLITESSEFDVTGIKK